MIDQRSSDNDLSKRDIPSFIEPRPPLILNPFMRPRPQKGTNLLEMFETDSYSEEPELVQVYLRLKPCNIASNLYEVKSDSCLITSSDTATVGHGRRTQYNVSKMYTFSHIFGPEANQRELFERIVKDNLKKLPDGHNFTLLTYGASGSGKTFTLMGTVTSPGLVPRSLEYVFRVVDAAVRPEYKPADNGAEKLGYTTQEHELQFVKQLRHVSAPLREKYRRMSVHLQDEFTASNLDLSNRIKYYVWVSFVEIYNEGIYDLLSTSDRRASSKLVIREDSNGNVYVKGATQVFVKTGEEAYDVMVAGKHNLQVAETGVNARSSRSHCIFTITMLTQTDMGCRVSSVRLCDLAGCERVRRTRNAGARLAESRAINTSLHVLERCLRTLRQRQRAGRDALVPYRESKLTRLLGGGLSGARGEAVSVVVTVNPAPDCAQETRHVLQLAAVAKDIQVNNTASEYSALEMSSQDTILSSHSTSKEILELRAENERLQFELIQAQTRTNDLMECMEKKQNENSNLTSNLVKEAQDTLTMHYKEVIRSLREEMEKMREEYEDRINKLSSQATSEDSPSWALKNKISDLMTEKDNLEAKLAAEVSARTASEQELYKLRAYVDELEEKTTKGAQNMYEEVVSLTESEDESEEDPFNESLEPIIRKDRSKLLRQSIANIYNTCNKNVEFDDSADADTDASEIKDCAGCDISEKEIDANRDTACKSADNIDNTSKNENNTKAFDSTDSAYFNSEPEIVLSCSKTMEEKFKQMPLRGTYFVRRSQDDSTSDESMQKEQEIYMNKNGEGIEREIKIEFKEELNDDISTTIDSAVEPQDDSYVNKSPQADCILNELSQKQEININKNGDKIERKIKIEFKEELNDDISTKTDMVIEPQDNSYLNRSFQADCNINELPREQEKNIIKNEVENKQGKNIGLNEENRNDKVHKKSESPIKFQDNRNCYELLQKKQEVAINRDGCEIKQKTKIQLTGERSGTNVPLTLSDSLVNRIIKTFKSNSLENSSNTSLAQFEQLEIAANDLGSDCKQKTFDALTNIKICNEKKNYFVDSIPEKTEDQDDAKELHKDKKVYFDYNEIETGKNKGLLDVKTTGHLNIDVLRSPSIIKDESAVDFESIKIKKLFGENFTKKLDTISINQKRNVLIDKKESVDPFEGSDSPRYMEVHRSPRDDVDSIKTSSNDMARSNKHEEPDIQLNTEPYKPVSIVNTLETEALTLSLPDDSYSIGAKKTIEDTLEVFEAIYKNISHPRATDFDLLVAQEESTRHDNTDTQDMTDLKYNLRNKPQSKKFDNLEVKKTESIVKNTRSLRLRRQRKQTNCDASEPDDGVRLKDIVNLQEQYSDVTMDIPAPPQPVKNTTSPEKLVGEENQPPVLGDQSCPFKSVTRSRRKLFTPRAEPLEEGLDPSGGSGERVRVPRPSYHRPRARRKL